MNRPEVSVVVGRLRDKLINNCPLANVLDFLTLCYCDGYECNTITGFRPEISAHHKVNDEFVVGQHPPMTDIFNLEPLQLRLIYFKALKRGRRNSNFRFYAGW